MAQPVDDDAFGYGIAATVAVTAILLIILGVIISQSPTERIPLLDADEQFMKAQFCVQTGRTPFVGRYHVMCYDYRHGGGEEEAP